MMPSHKEKTPFVQGRDDYQAGVPFEHAWKRTRLDSDMPEWKRGWIFERNTYRSRESDGR